MSITTDFDDVTEVAVTHADLSSVRKELLRELTRSTDRPGVIFGQRYAFTLVPLTLAAILLWLWPGVATGLAFAIVAGFTQNALGVLMHEASHYFFHRNRRVNDAIANLLVCLPLFNTVEGYRREHFHHHRRSGEQDDPYHDLYGGYRRSRDMTLGLIRDLIGVSAVQSFLRRYSTRTAHPAAMVALLAVQGLIAASLWMLTGWSAAWLWLWVLPLMTIPVAVNRMRTFVEHYPGFEAFPANRTTLTGALEYLCVAPYGYSHHFEHHFAPAVPYYRLAWAHTFLAARGIELRSHEYNSTGYLRTFRRMMRELVESEKRGDLDGVRQGRRA